MLSKTVLEASGNEDARTSQVTSSTLTAKLCCQGTSIFQIPFVCMSDVASDAENGAQDEACVVENLIPFHNVVFDRGEASR